MVNEHMWQDIETAPQGVSVLVGWTTTGLPPDDWDIAMATQTEGVWRLDKNGMDAKPERWRWL